MVSSGDVHSSHVVRGHGIYETHIIRGTIKFIQTVRENVLSQTEINIFQDGKGMSHINHNIYVMQLVTSDIVVQANINYFANVNDLVIFEAKKIYMSFQQANIPRN